MRERGGRERERENRVERHRGGRRREGEQEKGREGEEGRKEIPIFRKQRINLGKVLVQKIPNKISQM